MKNYGVKELPSKADLDRMLSKTKIRLLRQKGAVFLSTIMGQMEYSWDESIPTAATNGVKILWNPYFFVSLDEDTRVFVLAHELWHVAYQHMFRRGERDPMLWNHATDHAINTQQINDGYRYSVPFEIFKDQKYNGWSAERVYEDLHQNTPPGSGLPPILVIDGDGNQAPIQADPTDPSDPNHPGLNGDVLEGDPVDQQASIGAVIQAVTASKMAGERGVIPGEIEQIIDEYLNPVLPWDIILHQFLTELSNQDYSYRRPNRRFDDPILPSMMSDGSLQELNWYIDVSGSITDSMLLRFFSEMVHVKHTYNPERINIIQFDTRISKVIVLEGEDDFNSLTVHGRGGTDLVPVHEHIMETNPSAAIIFSDLECPPMEKVNIPVIWAIFGKPSKWSHEPDFGFKVRVLE